jgi:hypothetical protein
MKEGRDFNDTFAPVAKPATLRSLLAVATKHGFLLYAGDIETAFLTSDMDCEVWVKMPPFWGEDQSLITGTRTQEQVRRLLKGVPGIPQGSRLFYQTLRAELSKQGYNPSKADKCLFLNSTLAERTAVLLWVDDFIFMCEKQETWESFLAALRRKFTIPTVGPLRSFLGMDIQYDAKNRSMFISQSNTVEVLLQRAKMKDCNPSYVPCLQSTIFSRKDCPQPPQPHNYEFSSLIALANFLACWTRPDISYVVNKLCKFMSNPGEAHWKTLKILIRYLAATREKG